MTFDYERLGPQDFERLAADVLKSRERATFEQFSEGPDGGIDLRHVAADGTTIIGQAKRIADFSRLKRAVVAERDNLDRLQPSGYRLITCARLNPERKRKLQNELQPWAQNPSDIIGRDELDATLRENPDLVRSHVKLWLQDGEQLRTILHRAEESTSRDAMDDLCERARAFVRHRRADDAARLLEKSHCCLITGAPGAGKTALAGYLALQWAAEEGYEALFVRDREIQSARCLLQEGRRQVLILDDFLGAQFLESERGLAMEGSLLSLIRRIQNGDGEHKLLMTTRDYILQQARQRLERFHRDADRLDRVTLEVEALDEWERAHILVAQLDYAGVSSGHIRSLMRNSTHLHIVKHDNFTPRLAAETAEDAHQQPETGYPEWLKAQFDDPTEYWGKAFRHLSPAAQHLLYVLAVAGGDGAVDDLTETFHALHHDLALGRAQANALHDALQELEPNFAITKRIEDKIWLRYTTPAIGDLIQALINRDAHLKGRLIAHLRRFQHGLRLFQLFEGDVRPVKTDAQLRTQLFEQHRACLEQPALERQSFRDHQGLRSKITIPKMSSRIIRLWHAWNAKGTQAQYPTAKSKQSSSTFGETLSALAATYLPDEEAWLNAFSNNSHRPLLGLTCGFPDRAQRYGVWKAALETAVFTDDVLAVAEAMEHCSELAHYLQEEKALLLQAIDEAVDSELESADEPGQLDEALENLSAMEHLTKHDLRDSHQILTERLEELLQQEPEDSDESSPISRSGRGGAPESQLNVLFRQLAEAAP